MELTRTEAKLLVEFLEDYQDRIASQTCSDWAWPDYVSQDDREQITEEYYALNGDPNEENWIQPSDITYGWLPLKVIQSKLVESLNDKDLKNNNQEEN